MKKILSLLLALALCAGLGVPALAAAGFADVADSSPFAPAIAWAVEKGVTKGTTPTTFGPGETCTTSHILTFLWRAAGRPGDSGNERASVSAWAAGLGVDVSDLSAPCTRAAAVTDIWKAQGSPAASEAASFTDVSPSAPWAGAVSWAVEAGVTNGTGGGAFSPEAVCTRGQIVTFLYRALAGGAAEKPEAPAAGTGTLANGKPITEENVLAIIQELLVKYPDGMKWDGNTYRPGTASNATRNIAAQYTTAGYASGVHTSMQCGCGGFASLVSDTIFGSGSANPARKVPIECVRPGDIIVKLNTKGEEMHMATAASRITGIDEYGDKTSPIITVYHGNVGDSSTGKRIKYDTYYPVPKTYSDYNGYYVEVWTRYPTDNTTPWTGDAGSTGSSESTDSASSGNTSSGTSSDSGSDSLPFGAEVCDLCGTVANAGAYSGDRSRFVCTNCYQTPEGRKLVS